MRYVRLLCLFKWVGRKGKDKGREEIKRRRKKEKGEGRKERY